MRAAPSILHRKSLCLLSLTPVKECYTQEQLGEMTGLSIKIISAAENGHKTMRLENIVKICNCLSISTDYLLKGEDATTSSLAGLERLALLSEKQRTALKRIVNDFSQLLIECNKKP